MLIKVDYRETDLIAKLEKSLLQSLVETTIIVKIENLPIGDIIICDDNNNEKIIIERKTLQDLASSIKDGRYTEQGFRLNACDIHNHNIYYLIEGDLRTYKSSFNILKKTLLSAMVSISYFKGFSLHRTQNLDETAEWILQFANKLQKGDSIKSFYKNDKDVSNDNSKDVSNDNSKDVSNDNSKDISNDNSKNISKDVSYSEVIKRTKKENITLNNIGEIMLSQIPGVSISSSIEIMTKFKTITNLIESIKTDVNALNNIKVKNRKINKTCVENIYKYLSINN
jgi:crossover junction endonuclease MUS81